MDRLSVEKLMTVLFYFFLVQPEVSVYSLGVWAVYCQKIQWSLRVTKNDPKEGKIIFPYTEKLIIKLGGSTNSQDTRNILGLDMTIL